MKKLIELLKTADNDEERISLLGRINDIVKKRKTMRLVGSTVYRVSLFAVLFIGLFGTEYIAFIDDEKYFAAFHNFPAFIRSIIAGAGRIVASVINWRINGVPAWVPIVITAVIALLIVPAVLSHIAKLIVSFLEVHDKGPMEKSLYSCFSHTYKKMDQYYDHTFLSEGFLEGFLYSYSSWLPVLIPVILVAVYTVFLAVIYDSSKGLELLLTILTGITVASILFVILMVVTLIPQKLSALGDGIKDFNSMTSEVEKIWIDVDPQKKQEEEERKAAESRRIESNSGHSYSDLAYYQQCLKEAREYYGGSSTNSGTSSSDDYEIVIIPDGTGI